MMSDIKPTDNASVASQVRPTRPAAESKTSPQERPAGGKELPPAAAEAAGSPELTDIRSEVENAVSQLNDYIQSTQRDLFFSFDEDTGRSVITVTDRETDTVIRQIPEEVVLKLARNLNKEEPLRLFSARA